MHICICACMLLVAPSARHRRTVAMETMRKVADARSVISNKCWKRLGKQLHYACRSQRFQILVTSAASLLNLNMDTLK